MNATKQERICQQGKQDFVFGSLFFSFNGRCTFFFFYVEVVGKPQSHWVCFSSRWGCSFQPDGCRVGEPRSGDPQDGQEGKPGTNEAPFLGKAGARHFLPSRCPRADAAAAGDSQRAGERLPSSPAPYLPAAFPDGLTCRKIQRQGSCGKPSAKGRALGAAARLLVLGAHSRMDLGTEIWVTTSVLTARDHPRSHRPFPAQQLPVPAGMLQTNGDWRAQSRVELCSS